MKRENSPTFYRQEKRERKMKHWGNCSGLLIQCESVREFRASIAGSSKPPFSL